MAAGVALASAASGQLMVVTNSGGILLFSSVDGSLIDADWITEAGDVGFPSQPGAVEMIGDEIWVTGHWNTDEFNGIMRFDAQGNFLARDIATYDDNFERPYGLGTNGTNVLVAIEPNGSTIFNLDGEEVGTIGTLRAYDAEYYQGGIIAGSITNGALELFDAFGNYVGDFATGLVWPAQIVVQPDNSVIVANYLTYPQLDVQGVYHYNADGTVRTFIGTGTLGTGFLGVTPRGAVQLENGNYFITSAYGEYVAAPDGAGGYTFTLVSDANGFQIGYFTGTLPPPQCACELDGNAAQVDVFDLLSYLDLWFAGDAAAELDGAAGVDVFDLLAYLDCWFPASAGADC
jgi:hypothetical protein